MAISPNKGHVACPWPCPPRQSAGPGSVSPRQLPHVLTYPSPSFYFHCCSNPLHPHRGVKGCGALDARNYRANPCTLGIPPVLSGTSAPRCPPHSGPRTPLHAQLRFFLPYRLGQIRTPRRMQVRHTTSQLYRSPNTRA